MDNRPVLSKNLDAETFRNYYYLKEELIDFCRKNALQTTGGKIDLTNRIAHYLETGEKLSNRISSKVAADIGTIAEDTLPVNLE